MLIELIKDSNKGAVIGQEKSYCGAQKHPEFFSLGPKVQIKIQVTLCSLAKILPCLCFNIISGTQIMLTSLAPSSYNFRIQYEYTQSWCGEGARDVNNI